MDTIEGGKWLPHQELAWTLVTKAVERVRELENEIGCFFDRNPDGTLHGKAFAGQTFDRTVHKGDLTGIEIINRLMEQVWARPIRRLEEHRARRADPGQGRRSLAGVLLIDIRTGEFRFVEAQAVLLATGGGPDHVPLSHAVRRQEHGRARHGAARRPAAARHGDGAVPSDRAARRPRHAHDRHRAGGGPARRRRPSAQRRACAASWATTTRSSSAPRATSSAAPSMRRCAPAAPRRNGGVYIKMSHLGPGECAPSSSRAWSSAARDCGFDLAGGLVEVVPTAHYFMGGVVCGVDTSTELPGLFVAGEDASGMHGANRLGGNGVANSTVFGGIAGDIMPHWIAANPGHRAPDEAVLDAEVGARASIRSRARPATSTRCAKSCSTPCGTTSASCAIAAGLERGLAALDAHRGGAAGDRRGRRRPRLQPDLARLAQPALAGARSAGSLRSPRASARIQPRRALPRGFPGAGRPRDLDLHGGAADRRRASRSPTSRSSSPSCSRARRCCASRAAAE